jgi:hypothetical protein
MLTNFMKFIRLVMLMLHSRFRFFFFSSKRYLYSSIKVNFILKRLFHSILLRGNKHITSTPTSYSVVFMVPLQGIGTSFYTFVQSHPYITGGIVILSGAGIAHALGYSVPIFSFIITRITSFSDYSSTSSSGSSTPDTLEAITMMNTATQTDPVYITSLSYVNHLDVLTSATLRSLNPILTNPESVDMISNNGLLVRQLLEQLYNAAQATQDAREASELLYSALEYDVISNILIWDNLLSWFPYVLIVLFYLTPFLVLLWGYCFSYILDRDTLLSKGIQLYISFLFFIRSFFYNSYISYLPVFSIVFLNVPLYLGFNPSHFLPYFVVSYVYIGVYLLTTDASCKLLVDQLDNYHTSTFVTSYRTRLGIAQKSPYTIIKRYAHRSLGAILVGYSPMTPGGRALLLTGVATAVGYIANNYISLESARIKAENDLQIARINAQQNLYQQQCNIYHEQSLNYRAKWFWSTPPKPPVPPVI